MHNSTTAGPRSNTFAMADPKRDIGSLQHRAAIWATRSQEWLNSFEAKNVRRLALGSFWIRAVMVGDSHKVAIDNLMKEEEMTTQIVLSKEKMRRFGKHDVRLVATRRERERAIKYQALGTEQGRNGGRQWTGNV
jgi:hypothetical protein